MLLRGGIGSCAFVLTALAALACGSNGIESDGEAIARSPTNLLTSGAPGTTCSEPDDCTNGFCVDGVCCDTACGGDNPVDCLGCSEAVGATTDGTCQTLPANTKCRPALDACDVAEFCDGTSTACPPDALVTAGTICRPAAGDCDLPEVCTGAHPLC